MLIIVSSFLFADEFKRTQKRLDGNISLALNISRLDTENNAYNNCKIYPVDDLYFRAGKPTWIDITISVFVVGKYLMKKT